MISKRRLYLTQDNQVVEESHPDANQLLVGAGCEISDALAKRYGIYEDPSRADEALSREVEDSLEEQDFHGFDSIFVVIGPGEPGHVRLIGVFAEGDDAAACTRDENDKVVLIPFNKPLPDGEGTGSCEIELSGFLPAEEVSPRKLGDASEGQPDAASELAPADAVTVVLTPAEAAETQKDETDVNIETKDGAAVPRETDVKAEKATADKAVKTPAADKAVKAPASTKAVSAPAETK